jgi:hypothetical protein
MHTPESYGGGEEWLGDSLPAGYPDAAQQKEESAQASRGRAGLLIGVVLPPSVMGSSRRLLDPEIEGSRGPRQYYLNPPSPRYSHQRGPVRILGNVSLVHNRADCI